MGMMRRRRRFNINLFGGGSESEKWIVMVMVVLGIMMMITDQCWAQPQQHQQQDSSITSCVNQLIPCFNYLNLRGSHDDPPDSCCNPLKSVIKSDPECLCSMISIKATNAAQQYGINLTNAQQLPGSPNSKNSVTNSASSSPLVSSQSITSMPMATLSIIFSFFFLWRSM
ncbi:Lipid transfer-like protein VAS [Camellia lanceoleosa]|uniref:Lipid transfer-like protein VAS n=1 Tax=Camellia lanceoleosa TaxID=1840588 RepID=A0ACC0I4A1_9ERIC|nr:Lipid transfer-like protein VAS [Camellia lanceoleosa]